MLLGHAPNKVFLVHVPNSCGATEINGNSTSSDITDDTIENDLNDSCFNYFLTIWRCFGFFFIAGQTQYMYIVFKNKINLHSLQNRLEKLANGLPFYLFLKLVQIKYIFSDNVPTPMVYCIFIQINIE